jgi:N-acetylneuraminate 9-O-acetyltransferase
MNTDYISYYFSPLVSMWYLIVYATMAVGAQFNERTPVLVVKIIVSMAIVTYFMSQMWLLQTLFDFLERVCGIRWSAREWNFRVSLDLWIVYFGMFAAIAVIKIHEHRLTDHQYWPSAVKAAIVTSGVVMVWFFVFELLQESKFKYNLWHPYVSFLPVASFAVLRNATPVLRSASSRAFAFIGTCSLETFIIQYHFWLAGDTKGVLLVIPGTRWRPVNFVLTSIMFVYVSHRVAQASGEITTWICGGAKKSLPTTNPNAGAGGQSLPSSTSRRVGNASEVNQESIPLTAQSEPKGANGHEQPPTDSPGPTRRWVDRLADDAPSSSLGFSSWYNQTEWKLGLKTKLAVGMGVMWFVNVLWSYP